MTILITATSAGFHYISPLGDTMAPEVFFEGTFNRQGEIFQADAGQTWRTKESFLTPNHQVEARLARDAALPPGARAGDQTELALEGFDFVRIVNNVPEKVGTITFESIINVNATFAPNGSAAIGQGARPNWVAAVGDAIQTGLSREGFQFTGSDARDIFDPSFGFIPVNAAGVIDGFGGDDRLFGQSGGSAIRGGDGNDEIGARGGANIAWGEAGNDTIIFTGLTDAQRGFGGTGSDVMQGGRGGDALSGGRGKDRLVGADGDDSLSGGNGRDVLNGQEGNDRLVGGTGHDLIRGGFGDDTLIGGRGNDQLIGGAGADLFVFVPKGGNDRIRDFAPGVDHITLADSLRANATIADTARGALVSFDGQSGSILLEGVAADGLTNDMLFV